MTEEMKYPDKQRTTNLNFGEALDALKRGKKVARAIWGGYWYLAYNIAGTHIAVNQSDVPFGMEKMIIAVLKDNNGCAPAQAYQGDILAEDWQIVE